MQIGMVGLGKMGANMTQRLLEKGHDVVVFDVAAAARDEAAAKGARPAATLADLVAALDPPRAVWVMVPSGDPTTQTIILDESSANEPFQPLNDGATQSLTVNADGSGQFTFTDWQDAGSRSESGTESWACTDVSG